MNIRNRIKEYRVISPDDVKPNPRNWRTHPQAQRDALRGILAELVYDSARHGGLTLIDGHERMTVGVPFPALILDVTDEEADKLLATFDPISAMAETNAATLSDLLRDVSTDNAALAQMLIPLMRGQVAAHAEPLATIRAQKRQRMAFAAQLGGAIFGILALPA